MARYLGTSTGIADFSSADESPLLESILQHQRHFGTGFVDWNHAGPDVIYRIGYRQALLADRLAAKVGHDVEIAWMAGFLAPLGWLAMTATNPHRIGHDLAELDRHPDASNWQPQAWGYDHTAIARRLSRCWRLPVWLTAIVGQLGLHVRIVERLGAQPICFSWCN